MEAVVTATVAAFTLHISIRNVQQLSSISCYKTNVRRCLAALLPPGSLCAC